MHQASQQLPGDRQTVKPGEIHTPRKSPGSVWVNGSSGYTLSNVQFRRLFTLLDKKKRATQQPPRVGMSTNETLTFVLLISLFSVIGLTDSKLAAYCSAPSPRAISRSTRSTNLVRFFFLFFFFFLKIDILMCFQWDGKILFTTSQRFFPCCSGCVSSSLRPPPPIHFTTPPTSLVTRPSRVPRRCWGTQIFHVDSHTRSPATCYPYDLIHPNTADLHESAPLISSDVCVFVETVWKVIILLRVSHWGHSRWWSPTEVHYSTYIYSLN